MGKWNEINKFKIKVKNQILKLSNYRTETLIVGQYNYIRVRKQKKVLVDADFYILFNKICVVIDPALGSGMKSIKNEYNKGIDPKVVAKDIINKAKQVEKKN